MLYALDRAEQHLNPTTTYSKPAIKTAALGALALGWATAATVHADTFGSGMGARPSTGRCG